MSDQRSPRSEVGILRLDFYYDNGSRVYRVVADSVREAEEKAIDRHGEDWEKWVKVQPRPDFDPHIDYPERFKEGPI